MPQDTHPMDNSRCMPKFSGYMRLVQSTNHPHQRSQPPQRTGQETAHPGIYTRNFCQEKGGTKRSREEDLRRKRLGNTVYSQCGMWRDHQISGGWRPQLFFFLNCSVPPVASPASVGESLVEGLTFLPHDPRCKVCAGRFCLNSNKNFSAPFPAPFPSPYGTFQALNSHGWLLDTELNGS